MLKYLNDKANLITLIGLMCGTLSILNSFEKNWSLSATFMLLAVVCDVFDGIVARRFRDKDESYQKIGFQFDTLADIVHSGLAPGLFVFYYTGGSVFSFIFLFAIVTSAYLRLAYFNCNGLDDRNYFFGLPVFYSPMALFVALVIDHLLNVHLFIYIYSILIPLLHVSAHMRVKKFSEGILFHLFLMNLFGEILLSLFIDIK